jgi:hypothetical protein
MTKVLTVDDSTPAFSISPTFGTTEVQVVPSTSTPGGAVAPIPLSLVVDPNRVGGPGTGAWDGTLTFQTLQEAYDTLALDAVATIWLVPFAAASGLVIANNFSGGLTLRAMGDKEGAFSTIGSILIGNGNSRLTMHGITVINDIEEEGGEGSWNGILALHGCEIQGAINCPGAELLTFDYTSITGPAQTNVGTWFSYLLRNGSPDVLVTSAAVTWDAVSEQSYFQGIGATNIASGLQIFRTDDAACDGTIGADSGQVWPSEVDSLLRAICPTGRLTAPRIWQLIHSTSAPTGFFVDVWNQTEDLTIQDGADATLVTVPGGARAQRLTFFAAGGATEFELVGMMPFDTGIPV